MALSFLPGVVVVLFGVLVADEAPRSTELVQMP